MRSISRGLLAVILVVVLYFLVLRPLGSLLTASITGADGGLTFRNYVSAYTSNRNIQALVNSLIVGAGVVGTSAVFAIPLAWACSRTDLPGRNVFRLTSLGAFIMPPYIMAVGWILLAGPNSGWLNRIFTGVTGFSSGPFDIYSMSGLILIMSAHLFFQMFVVVSAALDTLPSDLEDAANGLGSGILRTARSITIPLVLPAILGSAIAIFLQSLALFAVPALISIPARLPVVTTQLWQFFSYPPRVEVAAAFSLPILIVTMLLIGLQRAILGRKGYASMGGKGGERRIIRLGRWRWPVFAYACIVAALTLIFPLAVLLSAAFSKAWAQGPTLGNFTLGNFAYVLFEHNTAMNAFGNSLTFAGITAIVVMGLTLVIAYSVQRHLLPFGQVFAFVCMAPIVVPGVVFAIGMFTAYVTPPFALYGTALLVVLAFVARFLPLGYTSATSALQSVNPEMEEAVRILGGTRRVAFTKVVAPLLKRSLFGGLILVFVPCLQEISTAIFLVTTNTRVISVVFLDMSEEGNFEYFAALGCVMLVVTVAIVALGFKTMGRDFMLRKS